MNLTTGQTNALNALYRTRTTHGPTRYCRPEGVQERTLFALVDMGLARYQSHVSGASFRITHHGLAVARELAATTGLNPVVRTTPLRAYPGWVVRQYADGMHDATNGVGLSPGFQSFAETVAHVRDEERAGRELDAAERAAAPSRASFGPYTDGGRA